MWLLSAKSARAAKSSSNHVNPCAYLDRSFGDAILSRCLLLVEAVATLEVIVLVPSLCVGCGSGIVRDELDLISVHLKLARATPSVMLGLSWLADLHQFEDCNAPRQDVDGGLVAAVGAAADEAGPLSNHGVGHLVWLRNLENLETGL